MAVVVEEALEEACTPKEETAEALDSKAIIMEEDGMLHQAVMAQMV
jgi:hypothetical protein